MKKNGTRKATSKKSAKRNGSRGRKPNGDQRLTKLEKQQKAVRLRFVQRWPEKDIAQQLNVSTRTVRTYLAQFRKMQIEEAEKNLKNEARSIGEDLKLSFDEKIKFLWNEFAKTDGNEESVGTMISGIQDRLKDLKDPDKITSLARQMAKLVDSQQSGLQKRLDIIALITDTESAHVNMLKDLGIIGSILEPDGDGDMLLVQIKERYRQRNANPKANGKSSDTAEGKQ